MRNQRLANYLYGMKKAIPVLIGFLPVAITYAIMARGAGIGAVETVVMSMAVFAGASQIMATGMLAGGAGAISVILSTFVLNLRHIIMSTCVFRKMNEKNPIFRLLCGFGVTDETFALYTTEESDRADRYYMLGLITVSYSSWVLGAVIGIVASNFLPPSLSNSFGVALYALFLALIVPGVKGDLRLFITVLITAAINCVMGLFLDSSWAIIVSTLVGAGIGVWLMECRPFGTQPPTGEALSEEAGR